MMIAPVIFCTVVHGIGAMGDLKKVRPGRDQDPGPISSWCPTLALAIGLIVGEIVRPGDGFNIDPGETRFPRRSPAT